MAGYFALQSVDVKREPLTSQCALKSSAAVLNWTGINRQAIDALPIQMKTENRKTRFSNANG